MTYFVLCYLSNAVLVDEKAANQQFSRVPISSRCTSCKPLRPSQSSRPQFHRIQSLFASLSKVNIATSLLLFLAESLWVLPETGFCDDHFSFRSVCGQSSSIEVFGREVLKVQSGFLHLLLFLWFLKRRLLFFGKGVCMLLCSIVILCHIVSYSKLTNTI